MIISARGVVKDYSGHRALDGLDLDVERGCVYGLLGPNGAGKTTFIRILNQMTKPDAGEVLFDGRALRREDVCRIGYLPEERGLYKKMKVGEQAIFLARLKGLSKQEAERRLRRWFEKFEIMGWWDRKVEELSKGMQQKVQFIVTVLHEPELLIFDEPFSGFDPVNANLLKREILELRDRGATVIFSTHNMSSVEEVCDNITLINDSRAVLNGSVREIKERFKTNSYMIRFEGGKEELREREEVKFDGVVSENGFTSARVVGREGMSSNDILRLLVEDVRLTSFEEVLPSMNEIFIDVVCKKEK